MQTTVHQTAWVTVYANNCTPNCLGHSVYKQLHTKLPGSQCMQTTVHQTAWVTASVCKQLHIKLPGSKCMQRIVHQTAWVTVHANNCTSNCLSDSFTHRHKISPPPKSTVSPIHHHKDHHFFVTNSSNCLCVEGGGDKTKCITSLSASLPHTQQPIKKRGGVANGWGGEAEDDIIMYKQNKQNIIFPLIIVQAISRGVTGGVQEG